MTPNRDTAGTNEEPNKPASQPGYGYHRFHIDNDVNDNILRAGQPCPFG